MVDSAPVFIGPFPRLDTNAPVPVNSAFVSGTPAPTSTQFSSGTASLSNVDGFYNGQIVQFNSGALAGQAKVITNYIGATHTFIFSDGFTGPPRLFDNFTICTARVTCDFLA